MDKYKLLIAEINNTLKLFEFKKRGETFFCKKNNNIGIIDFQKSRSSIANDILFTINLGVYSSSLQIFDGMVLNSKPTISDCHWKKRIGFLMSQNQDYWWKIDSNSSLPILITEILELLKEKAIPEILKYISDESLEKSWMNGISEGLTEQQMYLYLIALLKANNKPELDTKVKELKSFSKGKPFYNNVKENLEKLGITDV